MYTSHVYKQCTAWKVPRWLNMGKKCDGGFLSTLLNKVLNATQSHGVIQFHIVLFWHILDECINAHLLLSKQAVWVLKSRIFGQKSTSWKKTTVHWKFISKRIIQKKVKSDFQSEFSISRIIRIFLIFF